MRDIWSNSKNTATMKILNYLLHRTTDFKFTFKQFSVKLYTDPASLALDSSLAKISIDLLSVTGFLTAADQMVVKASLKDTVLEDTRRHQGQEAGSAGGRDRIVRLLESKTADNPKMIEVG